MLAIALALASSVSWGCADFLGGLQSRRVSPWLVAWGMEAAGLVPLLALLALTAPHLPDTRSLTYGIGAGLAGGLAIALLYRALALGVMAIAAPISATGAALPVIYGVARGERPGTIAVVGLVLALAGIVLASFEPAEHDSRVPWRTGVWMALGAALGIGIFLIAASRAAHGGAVWASVAFRAGSLVTLTIMVIVTRPSLGAARGRLRAIGLVGLLDAGAGTLYAFATTKGLLSLVSVLGALYPVTTVALAAVALRERVERVQAAGVACALLGVVLIAGGQ